MLPRTPLFILASDPANATLLANATSRDTAEAPRLPRNALVPLRLYLLEELPEGGDRLYRELDLDDYTSAQVAAGLVDTAPTAGTFALSVNGNSTGLTALAYSISAASLAALISAIEPVTVTKSGSALFTVTVTATNTGITWTKSAAGLSPLSTITISEPVAPDVDVQAVYTIEILQSPYAYSDDWTPRETSDAVGTFTVDTGTEVATTSGNHLLAVGDSVILDSSGTLPAPAKKHQKYWVKTAPSGTTLTLTDIESGSTFDFTDTGSGTHTMYRSRDGVTISKKEEGSNSAVSRFEIEIEPFPAFGAFRILHGEAQTAVVTCQGNPGAKAQWSLTPLAESGLATGCYFDITDDWNGRCRFWIDIDDAGASAPDYPTNPVGTISSVDTGGETITASVSIAALTPIHFTTSNTLPGGIVANTTYYWITGGTTSQITDGGGVLNITTSGTGTHTIHKGRAVEITTIATGDSLGQVAGKLQDALNSDGDWVVSVNSLSILSITAATVGLRSVPASSGNSGFAISTSNFGSNGTAQGKGFVLFDQNGSVGVYCTVGGLPAEAPAWAADCTRTLPVAITAAGSAATIAEEIKVELAADSEFGATRSGNRITVTDAVIGARGSLTTAQQTAVNTANAGAFSVAITKRGTSNVAIVPFDSDASDIQRQLSGWNVEKTGAHSWALTATSLGARTAPSLEPGTLEFLRGLDGTLRLDTIAMHQAHAIESDTELIATIEVKTLFDGDEAPRLMYQGPCLHPADLINGDIAAAPQFSLFRHGATAVTATSTSVAITFSPAFASPPTKVFPGPLKKTDPGDADPPLVKNTESITDSGATVVFTGPLTDNATLPWFAIA